MKNKKNIWIFTFGYGQQHEGHYVEIEANSEKEAREVLFRMLI